MLHENYEKWSSFSVLGLLIISLGLSLTGNAIASKSKGKNWFIKSIIGLIVFNSGIVIFGEAVKARALYEWELKKLRKED